MRQTVRVAVGTRVVMFRVMQTVRLTGRLPMGACKVMQTVVVSAAGWCAVRQTVQVALGTRAVMFRVMPTVRLTAKLPMCASNALTHNYSLGTCVVMFHVMPTVRLHLHVLVQTARLPMGTCKVMQTVWQWRCRRNGCKWVLRV